MKQKEIFINPSLGLETEEMIKMLFATKTVGKVEGFIYSIAEILRIYKNSYAINDLRNSKYYSVYMDQCQNCSQDYEIIIRNRTELYKHLNLSTTICNECIIYKTTIEGMLRFKI